MVPKEVLLETICQWGNAFKFHSSFPADEHVLTIHVSILIIICSNFCDNWYCEKWDEYELFRRNKQVLTIILDKEK